MAKSAGDRFLEALRTFARPGPPWDNGKIIEAEDTIRNMVNMMYGDMTPTGRGPILEHVIRNNIQPSRESVLPQEHMDVPMLKVPRARIVEAMESPVRHQLPDPAVDARCEAQWGKPKDSK